MVGIEVTEKGSIFQMAGDEWLKALLVKTVQVGQIKVWEDSYLVSKDFMVIDNSC